MNERKLITATKRRSIVGFLAAKNEMDTEVEVVAWHIAAAFGIKYDGIDAVRLCLTSTDDVFIQGSLDEFRAAIDEIEAGR